MMEEFPRHSPLLFAGPVDDVAQMRFNGSPAPGVFYFYGSVSNVEMVTPMTLIYKVLFSSISTFETPPPHG
jgi:hypothetical protein